MLGYWRDLPRGSPYSVCIYPGWNCRRVFITKYLQIISEYLINGSVSFIGISQIWGIGLPCIPNILDCIEATGWVSSSNDPKHIWGGSFTDLTSMTNVPWGGSVNARPAYLSWRPVSLCVAQRRVCKVYVHHRRHQHLRRQYNQVLRQGRYGDFSNGPQLNNVFSKNSLLVWVTVSGLLIISSCASLAVVFFNSYPASFIVNLLIASTSSSDLSSFSLVKIVSAFSLCELDAWLNALAVMLLASVIYYSSSSIMTSIITSRVFTSDNGVSLLSLKVVMVSLSSV